MSAIQTTMFGDAGLPLNFDGPMFDAEKDSKRLTNQLLAVRDYMLAHSGWRTVPEIRDQLTKHAFSQGACIKCGRSSSQSPCVLDIGKASETGISARLRDLRKVKFGAYVVERRRRGEGGLYEYRVTERFDDISKPCLGGLDAFSAPEMRVDVIQP